MICAASNAAISAIALLGEGGRPPCFAIDAARYANTIVTPPVVTKPEEGSKQIRRPENEKCRLGSAARKPDNEVRGGGTGHSTAHRLRRGWRRRMTVAMKTQLLEDAPPWVQNVAQLVSLLCAMWYHIGRGFLGVWISLFHPLTWLGERHPGVSFVVGRVHHARLHPVRRSFSYPLRLAVVDLDNPPSWFVKSGQAKDHLTAAAARARSGADGRVLLLTSPWTFGYVQNPISVYYVYDMVYTNERGGGDTKHENDVGDCRFQNRTETKPKLRVCAAEVTNTPWGERVVFDFDPSGQRVPKSLHVSPFMDTAGDWFVSATDPMDLFLNRASVDVKKKGDALKTCEKLAVHVNVVGHPLFGDYFRASFVGCVDNGHSKHARNERAGLRILLRHACTPHRVAFWIYAQAVRVLWCGVPFFPPPGLGRIAESTRWRGDTLLKTAVHQPESVTNPRQYPKGGCPLRVTYREARGWPWKT